MTGLFRKHFWLAMLFVCAMPTALAQGSNQPLRLIVITQAGGAADQFARLVGEGLSKTINRTVLVENKPGAGGNIASQFVARSAPDGNTFLVTSNNHTVNTALYANPGYSMEDLVPVIQIGRGPSVMVVHTSSPFKSVKELIESARNKPLPYGSIGVGSGAHLVAECLRSVTSAKLEHVPYKGGAPAVSDVVGGQVPMVMTTLASAGQFVRAEKLRALAVSSSKRWSEFTDVPTLAESGWPDCTIETWIGVVAPKGTPSTVIAKMNADIAAVLHRPGIKEKMIATGYEPVGDSAASFAQRLSAEHESVTKLIKRSGISAD